MYKDPKISVRLMCDAVHYREVEKYSTGHYDVNPAVICTCPASTMHHARRLVKQVRRVQQRSNPSNLHWKCAIPLQSRLRALQLSRRRRTRSHELFHISCRPSLIPSHLINIPHSAPSAPAAQPSPAPRSSAPHYTPAPTAHPATAHSCSRPTASYRPCLSLT